MDKSVTHLAEEELRRFRNQTFGFLFHNPCLLPSFSVAENVAMPLFRICGTDAGAARVRTSEVLDFCGIAHLENQLAGRLVPSAQRRAGIRARSRSIAPASLSPYRHEEAMSSSISPMRTAQELGLCVLWAADDGGLGERDRSASFKYETDASALTNACECPYSAACRPVERAKIQSRLCPRMPPERAQDGRPVFYDFCRAVDDIADEPGRSPAEKA